MFDFRFDGMPGMAASRARLGVQVETLSDQLAEYFGVKGGGVLVSTVTAASPAEHLQSLAHNLQLGPFLAFRFPLIELQSSFDERGRALAQILTCDFSGAAPQGDVNKSGFLNPFAGLVLTSIVHGQTNFCDSHSALQILHFHVPGQIAQQDYAVETGHKTNLFKLRRSRSIQ
jgi:hypothetical protein